MSDLLGWERIRDERIRQVEEEGWTAEHDDRFNGCELADAARCYILAALWKGDKLTASLRNSAAYWPWEESWWKPSTDPIRNLEKAGALIAAEIDRLTRSKEKGPNE